MNYPFKRIAITIAIIAFAITLAAYSLNIRVLWVVILDLEANSIAAIASAVIAGLIFITTLWQILRNDKRNKILVRPLLEFGGYIGDGDKQKNKKNSKFEVTVVNRGVGPAVIENFILKIDGEEKSRNNSNDYHDSLEKLLKNFKPLMNTHLSSGSTVQVGEEIVVLRFKYNAKADNIDFINKVEILVEYQSIYKDEIIPKKYKNEHNLDHTEF